MYLCESCGTSFDLPEKVRERYPDWSPKRCRSCHDRATGRVPRNGAGGTAREENLPVGEILEKYEGGPDTGVFTDGAADPNPGPGGWGAVHVVDGEIRDQAYGHEPHTTNNRMELTALIAGYDLVPPGEAATVYTDSRLCVDTITKWASGWERRGWVRKTGEIKNLDLVQELYARAKARPEITLTWIRAHAGARWNEYADALATAYRRDVL